MPPRLPSAASPCEVPRFFAPSTWERLELCPFSVWTRDKALPDTPEAMIGTLLHAARKEILERGLVGEQRSDDVKALLGSMVATEEERLARSEEYKDLVPLSRVVGARRWLEMTTELGLWARTATGGFTLARRRAGPSGECSAASPSPDGANAQDAFAYGIERAWTSIRCRLKGRPDEARLAADGVVEIVDYKSGDSLDSEGKPLPAVQTQLQLYMLMAEVLSNRTARGYVQDREVTPVAWGPQERAQLEERVSVLGSRFPVGAVVDDEAAAKAGRHCIGCRMRPRCTVYLRDVPAWWENSGEHDRPLPYDAWGVIANRKRDALGWTVMLDDVAGRRVLLRGISDRHGIGDLAVGDQLFAFGLEPTEDVNVHGRRLHPRSFHERSPGPRWPSASQVRMYRG